MAVKGMPTKCTPLLQYHLNRPFRTDRGTDPTSLTIIEVNLDCPGLFIPCDAEIGAEETTDLTRFAFPQAETALGLYGGFFSQKAQFHRSKSFFSFFERKAPSFGNFRNNFLTLLNHSLTTVSQVKACAYFLSCYLLYALCSPLYAFFTRDTRESIGLPSCPRRWHRSPSRVLSPHHHRQIPLSHWSRPSPDGPGEFHPVSFPIP